MYRVFEPTTVAVTPYSVPFYVYSSRSTRLLRGLYPNCLVLQLSSWRTVISYQPDTKLAGAPSRLPTAGNRSIPPVRNY